MSAKPPTGDVDRHMAGKARVLLILPCHNEAGAIAQILREIHVLNLGYDTLVVDDGSTDGTHEIASPLSRCVRLVANLGIGGAVQTGIQYAYASGYDYCIQIDGDGQHPADQIRHLIESARSTAGNVVVGSRYLRGESFRSTALRRLGSRLISRFLRRFFGGVRLTDPTSGMRLMDRMAMRLFASAYPHDYPEPISLAWALRRGLTIVEVPVTMRERIEGRSTISGIKTVSYMVRVLSYIVLTRFQFQSAVPDDAE